MKEKCLTTEELKKEFLSSERCKMCDSPRCDCFNEWLPECLAWREFCEQKGYCIIITPFISSSLRKVNVYMQTYKKPDSTICIN